MRREEKTTHHTIPLRQTLHPLQRRIVLTRTAKRHPSLQPRRIVPPVVITTPKTMLFLVIERRIPVLALIAVPIALISARAIQAVVVLWWWTRMVLVKLVRFLLWWY